MTYKGTVWVLGASSGLGYHTAAAFAQSGWLVIAGARSFCASSADKDGFIKLPLDVTSEESCDSFAASALTYSPRVDVLVCAAAVLVLGSCEKTATDEYARVLNTNFLGTVRMVNRALPLMRQNGKGKIVLFSSINGLLGIPFQSAYTASKHALEGYAECLAMETKTYGVEVCLVEPGDHRGGSGLTRLSAEGENDASPYRAAYKAACAKIHQDEANGLLPRRLGKKVVRNVQRRHMPFRLRVAKADQHLAVLLHTILPAWANAQILIKYYRRG